jgi:hypothetical protein
MMILAIIDDSMGHISAEAIHRKVRERYPFVNISTIYRSWPTRPSSKPTASRSSERPPQERREETSARLRRLDTH